MSERDVLAVRECASSGHVTEGDFGDADRDPPGQTTELPWGSSAAVPVPDIAGQ